MKEEIQELIFRLNSICVEQIKLNDNKNFSFDEYLTDVIDRKIAIYPYRNKDYKVCVLEVPIKILGGN